MLPHTNCSVRVSSKHLKCWEGIHSTIQELPQLSETAMRPRKLLVRASAVKSGQHGPRGAQALPSASVR